MLNFLTEITSFEQVSEALADAEMLRNIIWTMVGVALVYFMQAGFAMVEAGFTRAKNSGNIVMKNLMDFVLGSIFFFIIGYGIMFGTDAGGVIGTTEFFGNVPSITAGLPTGVFFIFQTVFCATSATIVSGAMAERTKFISYLIYSACISIFIYPVTGHWVWGGLAGNEGWLGALGFHDFAGSTVVHMVGGICAFIGAKILGPRIGKYNADGSSNAIPGHNIPIGALGVFILWFGWFGFNCGSTTAATTTIGDIAMTTNLSAAAATLVTLIITWVRYGKPDISMTLNGSLAGLVAITAGCDVVSNWGALAIGIIAGTLVVFAIEFIDKKVKVDDPVGAVSVHGICGATGTILTGLFAVDGGLFYGGGFKFLGTQLLGVISVMAYVTVIATIMFIILKKTIGLRVSEKEELDGLDVHEHGCSAYPDFQIKL